MDIKISTLIVPAVTRNKRIYTDGSHSSAVNVGGSSPQGGSDKNYVHTQNIPALLWTIIHNLNKYPSVTVLDTSKTEVEGEVRFIDTNTLELHFSAEFAGSATLN